MAKRTVIVVQVARGILWVGGEAYPLHNIARATTIRIEPDRKAAVWRFIRYAVILAILTVAAFAVSDRVDWSGGEYGNEQDVMRGVTIVVLVLAAAFTIQLCLVLAMRTYYALVIETSGTPRAVLVSADPREVGGLVYQITDAISNPQAASFRTEITNFYNSHIGDKINQIGGVGNTGKRVGS